MAGFGANRKQPNSESASAQRRKQSSARTGELDPKRTLRDQDFCPLGIRLWREWRHQGSWPGLNPLRPLSDRLAGRWSEFMLSCCARSKRQQLRTELQRNAHLGGW